MHLYTNFLTCLPAVKHLRPSPLKPSLQVQEKEPSLFEQVAFASQLCRLVVHSLISVELMFVLA